jgi:hypothetical protein
MPTQPTNTYDSYDAANAINEDLHQIIYDISPTETPVLSMAAQGTCSNTLHEWLTDALDAVDSTNARIEGEDKDAAAVAAPSRLTNYTQISDKTIVLSGTTQAVDNVGGADELARQVARKAQALKRDMEAIITGNQAAVAGDNTTARKLRSLEAWYPTANSVRGTGGSAGTTTLAATDATTGDLRAIRESYLKDAIQKVWTLGGNSDAIVAGGVNKQRISGFAGNATRVSEANEGKLSAYVDVYASDFGRVMKIIPNRFSRSRTVHVLDSEMLSVDYLRKFHSTPLAKTGDSEKRLVLAEYTLRMNNPNAHGVVADLTS